MSGALTYWHSGGEVCCTGGLVLSASDVEALRAVHVEEVRAARAADRDRAGAQAQRLARELNLAFRAADQWRRASGGVRARRIIFP